MTKKKGEGEAPAAGIAIEAGVLAAAMKHAAGVVETRNTIPILANVRLFADGGMLELVATDLDVEIRQSVPLAEAGRIATTVDAKRLFALASAVDGAARIELAPEENRLAVKSGRSRWLLPCLKVDDFPMMPFGDAAAEIAIDAEMLAAAVGRTAHSVSTEPNRYYLNGTFFNAEDGHLRLASTNGHILSVVDLAAIEWPEGAPEAIVPPKFLHAVTHSLEKGEIALSWNGAKMRAEMGDTLITGKAIDGTFPDYRRVQPRPQESPALLDPADLRAAIRRVKLISTEKTRAAKIVLGQDKITVSMHSVDSGTACEEVPAQCEAGHETGFNADYLGDMLDALGGDTVEFHHADAAAPALLRRRVPESVGGTMAGTIMPMRV